MLKYPENDDETLKKGNDERKFKIRSFSGVLLNFLSLTLVHALSCLLGGE